VGVGEDLVQAVAAVAVVLDEGAVGEARGLGAGRALDEDAQLGGLVDDGAGGVLGDEGRRRAVCL